MSPKVPTLRDPRAWWSSFGDEVMPEIIFPEIVSGKLREDRNAAGVCRCTAAPPIHRRAPEILAKTLIFGRSAEI
jgi:hypothetical protein